MNMRPSSSGAFGTALVTLQFLLIAALAALGVPPFLHLEAPWGAWVLAVGGALLGAWAIAHNRPGNFNIRPVPREGGALVEQGPYRWIRHPMYTSVIVCGTACAWVASESWGWIALAALSIVLGAKAWIEERLMLDAHAGYGEYRRRTSRFLPGL